MFWPVQIEQSKFLLNSKRTENWKVTYDLLVESRGTEGRGRHFNVIEISFSEKFHYKNVKRLNVMSQFGKYDSINLKFLRFEINRFTYIQTSYLIYFYRSYFHDKKRVLLFCKYYICIKYV